MQRPTERGHSCPQQKEDLQFYQPDLAVDKHTHRLPHWQQDHTWTFVTWRLADSLPSTKLNRWLAERDIWLRLNPKPWDAQTEAGYHQLFSNKLDDWLDEGIGSCILEAPANAQIIADALDHFDGERYDLASAVIMPNHVHVLFRPVEKCSLPEIIKTWKGFTSRMINKRTNKSGPLWQANYWDRLIRSERHYFRVSDYIRNNPGKAKLREGQYLLIAFLAGRNARAPLFFPKRHLPSQMADLCYWYRLFIRAVGA